MSSNIAPAIKLIINIRTKSNVPKAGAHELKMSTQIIPDRYGFGPM